MKKRSNLLLTLLIFQLVLFPVAFAQPEPEDIEGITSITDSQDSLLQPVAGFVLPLLKELSIVVGGIFGLYIILILIRIYYERKKVKILEDIRFDLDQINSHQELPTSHERKTLFRMLTKKASSLRLRKRKTREEKK